VVRMFGSFTTFVAVPCRVSADKANPLPAFHKSVRVAHADYLSSVVVRGPISSTLGADGMPAPNA
jgi:hypothetical protein